MISKIKNWLLKKNTILNKILLTLLICSVSLFFNNFSFHKIETFIRDSLQYLNSTNTINNSIVTVNIESKNTFFERPFKSKPIIELIKKINLAQPKSIVLLIEPNDLTEDSHELKNLYNFLIGQKNIFLNASASRKHFTSFAKHEIFKNYSNFFEPPSQIADENFGAKDKKYRRALLEFKNIDSPTDSVEISKIGLNAIDYSHFQFPFKLWDTTQVYIKTFPVGTFGHYSSDLILNSNNNSKLFSNKIVLIGAFDEFSFFSQPSVFDLFGQLNESNFKTSYYPFQDYVGNILNLYTTGDYIKFLSNFNDLLYVTIILILLVLIQLKLKTKIILFYLIIPINLFFLGLIYRTESIYIDLSRSISMLLFLQYFTFPIGMVWYFRNSEIQRLADINEAKVEALLRVSEQVAHDIRSPLSVVNLLISKAIFDTPEQLQLIKNSIERIDNIVSNILTNQKYSYTDNIKTKFDVKNAISSVLAEKSAISKNVQINFQCVDNYSLIGSQVDFCRAISNLIDNSIEAIDPNKPKSFINIKTTISNSKFMIEIVDNGLGISSEILNLLGKQRIKKNEHLNKKNSNGIGFLHSKKLVEKMNGNMLIGLNKECGTTVTIYFKV